MLRKFLVFVLVAVFVINLTACAGSKNNSTQTTPTYEERELGAETGIAMPGNARMNSKNQMVVYDRGSESPRYAILDGNGKPAGEIRCDFSGDGNIFALDRQDNLYVMVQSPVSDNEASRQVLVYDAKGQPVKTLDLGKVPLDGGMMFGNTEAPPPGDNLRKTDKEVPAGGKKPAPQVKTFAGPAKGSSAKPDGASGAQPKMMPFMGGVADMAVDSKGSLFLLNMMQGIEVYYQDGKQLKTLGTQGYTSMAMDEQDNLIVGGFNRSNGRKTLEKIKTATGESIWKRDTESTGGMMSIGGSDSIRYSKADKSIYVMNDKGVKKYTDKGEQAGEVLDFKMYTILASDNHITGMVVDMNKNFYVLTTPAMMSEMQQAEKQKTPVIYAYTLQAEGKTAKDQKVITLSVPKSDRFLEVAVSIFHKANPGIRIDVKEYPDADIGSDEYEKYIKSLNTGILTGKGPDILSAGELPYQKYAAKNILVDLSKMIAEDKSFDLSKYNTAVLEGLKYKGALYTMPISYTMEVLAANKGLLDKEGIVIDDSQWTWDDFRKVAEKVTRDSNNDGTPDQSAFSNIPYTEFLRGVLSSMNSSFVDTENRKASFDSQEFLGLMQMIKSFVDLKLVTEEPDESKMMEMADRGSVAFMPQTIQDYVSLQVARISFNGEAKLLNMPSGGKNNGLTYTCETMLAINKNSKYVKEAWEFIKFLLSDETQSQMELRNFSLNKAAQHEKGKQMMEMMKAGRIKIKIKAGKDVEIKPITEEDMAYADKLTEGVKVYAGIDRQILKIVQEELRTYLVGNKSAEETAALIQSRVSTYLNE
jgi:multiple sugar transport system substrate-binding protein